MRGLIITATGWTFEYLDGQPFDRISALFQYWRKWPPSHVLQRSIAGYKPAEDSAPAPTFPSPTKMRQPGPAQMMDPEILRGVGQKLAIDKLPGDVATIFKMAEAGVAPWQKAEVSK